MEEYQCPRCSAKFDTRRGLGVHHTRVHDERLPNRTCDNCGERFYSEYERRYCSEDCVDATASYEGESNPNYKGGKLTTTCEICEQEFEYYPSAKEGLYCSDCVETESWRNPPLISGSDHPRWDGGKIALTCDICGEDFERHPSGITGEATLCGKECLNQWVSNAFTGDGHPNWCGGSTAPYGKGWNEVRERALERDGHACVVCGIDAEALGRNPDVHHLVPVRLFVESPVLAETDAHTLDNVATLCPSCHRKAEFGKITPAELRWRTGMTSLLTDSARSGDGRKTADE